MREPYCLPLPLGRRATVVGQVTLGGSAVGLVVVQISSEDVAGAVELSASSLVVTGQNHVRNLGGNITHPLLPQIPIRLVHGAHITTLGATLVGDFALGQGFLVLIRDGATTGQGSAGAVVADRPVILAGQNARVPVISITEVSTMPGKRGTLVGGLNQILVSAMGVGVAHVVDDSHAELLMIASLLGGLETQDLRLSRAIGSRDLVIVGVASLEVVDGNLVKELTALGDSLDLRARRGAVITCEIELAIISMYASSDKDSYVWLKPDATLSNFLGCFPHLTSGARPRPKGVW